MIRPIVVFVLGAALAGCKQSPPAQADSEYSRFVVRRDREIQVLDSLRFDLTTPDRALKSRWALLDAWAEVSHRAPEEAPSPIYTRIDSLQRNLLGNDARDEHVRRSQSLLQAPLFRYDRQIIDIKQESDSRAVITALIRNVTPMPAGMRLEDPYDKQRRDGDRVRFVYEKFADGWKLTQIFSKYTWSDEWRPRYASRADPSEGAYNYATTDY